ncbi:MAG TPA: iron-sulfur protein, partial [Thermoplasmata archaeon]|nr:iron-sulfur protein [Thermoplasmata archaeon]
DAISGKKGEVHLIDEEKCVRCGLCYSYCPPKVRAIKKVDRRR